MSATNLPATSLLLDCAVRKLRQQAERIAFCLSQLTAEQIWRRGGENENAVGNLVLHLSGNVRQWILTGLGSHPDHRDRDLEFSTREGPAASRLAELLHGAVEEVAELLPTLSEATLTSMFEIQKYRVSGVEVVVHVVEHFSYHTGQIIFATKAMTGANPEFYRHLDALDHSETTP